MNTTFIDQKYISYISGRLRNFRNKGSGLFEFSHTCESPTSNRRRGYFYKKGNGYNFFCHNCQTSVKFFTFLKSVDPNLYSDYTVEVFKENMVGSQEKTTLFPEEKPKEKQSGNLDGLRCYTDLPKSHPALKYVERRAIPIDRYDLLYFCPKFNTWASKYNDKFKPTLEDSPRLVIPFFDRDKNVVGFTCRAYGKEEPKYIELKINKDEEMIYGLERIDLDSTIYAVEGPIDSLFLDNCIAVSGASYGGQFFKKHKDQIVIVPDNDWKRNPHVLKSVQKMASEGYTISFFPDSFDAKDINKAIQSGKYTSNDIRAMIDKEKRSGMELNLEIAFRRKC